MKNFHVKFTAKNLTGNAGLVHLGKFAEKLQLPKTLKKVISIKRGHTAIAVPVCIKYNLRGSVESSFVHLKE